MTKICNKCFKEKPLDAFLAGKNCVAGRRRTCKACYNSKRYHSTPEQKEKRKLRNQKYQQTAQYKAQQARWNESVAGRRRRFELRLAEKYGWTGEDWARCFHAQSGRCAACAEPFLREPHVDHDHGTGQVRGLLCAGCNTALGLVKENLEALRGLAAYVERWKQNSV